MQIYIAIYLKKSYVVGRCKLKMKGGKNREYFIINATRVLSSSDFSSDTAGGCLKVKGVNKLSKEGVI